MKQLRYLLFAVIILLVACNGTTRGSGQLKTEEREVSEFNQVELTGAGTVIISTGQPATLVIEAEENLLPLITSEVQNDKLILGWKSGVTVIPTKPVTFNVSMEEVEGLVNTGSGDIQVNTLDIDVLEIDLSGSGSIVSPELDGDTVDVTISGSGSVDLAGQVTSQIVNLSSSGEYETANLASRTADINLSGSGTATIRVEDTLDATISSSGSIRYYGDPIVNSEITGSGNLVKVTE